MRLIQLFPQVFSEKSDRTFQRITCRRPITSAHTLRLNAARVTTLGINSCRITYCFIENFSSTILVNRSVDHSRWERCNKTVVSIRIYNEIDLRTDLAKFCNPNLTAIGIVVILFADKDQHGRSGGFVILDNRVAWRINRYMCSVTKSVRLYLIHIIFPLETHRNICAITGSANTDSLRIDFRVFG